MNSLTLLVIALIFFALAYRYYAAFIAAKVLVLNDDYVTPAYTCNDGHDYVPMNKWVLFGHHFAAIAGAGPLIGPVLAAQYGWGPGFLWILLGSVFAGCVHDMIVLFASVRHKGKSLATIARTEVGEVSGITTALSVLFIIVVALAGLAIAVVNALYSNPWGVFTIGMTIPIAIIVGIYMFKLNPGAIKSGSVIGVVLVLWAVMYGATVAHAPWAHLFVLTKNQLSVALPLYGFIAAALPVWLLLAPRDYLSTYMKIGTVLLLAIGVVFVHPNVHMPFATQFTAGGGPVIPGPWWPYVFITIACGAISGFHSLISSGTTPKMLEKESQITMIGYGAMLVEAFVGIMALIAATVLMPPDYFAINTSHAVFAKLNMHVINLPQLSQLVGIDVSARPGGAVSLAVGMSYIFSSIPGMGHLMAYWYQFAIMFEALFILTTIDAGTRVARFILQDILGTYVYAPLKETNWLPGSIFCAAVVSFSWGYLLYGGDISTIWPLFGVANQLLAVVALTLGTTIILKISANKSYALITFTPLVLLAVTVIAAGVMNVGIFLQKHDFTGNLDAGISIILVILVAIIIIDNARKWLELLKTEKPVGMNVEPPVCEVEHRPAMKA